MKPNGPNLLALLLQDFFSRQLPNLRGMSPHTIQSYRDSLVLLLRFVALQKKNRGVSTLDLEDLGIDEVQSFLDYLERERESSVTTRNVRLSAIHSFFRFVAAERPDRLEHAQRILGIPFKRTQSRVIEYLEYEEIEKILSAIDRSNRKGRRDYTLLATMFNTGARVQEILDLRGCDLRLTPPYQLYLTGKGRKQRCCPLWPQTAKLLRHLCRELEIGLNAEVRIFQNCRGTPLTRFGVRYILAESLRHAQASMPSLASKRLHPHSLRHSTAVALLKSGVDLTTIGQWLGHASPNTTNRYAAVDLEMKRKAIAQVKPLQASGVRSTPWRHGRTILEWLESL
jgi:site-specific recombinase XerD